MYEIPLGLERHPLSAVFGDLAQEEMDSLARDIFTNGQKELVAILDGKVLDGWHRYLACEAVGVKCMGKDFPTEANAIAWVASKNLHRRSLSKAQRAVIEYRLACLAAGEKPVDLVEAAKRAGATKRTMQRAAAAEKAGDGDAVLASIKPLPQARQRKSTEEVEQLRRVVDDQKVRLQAAAHELEWLSAKDLPETEQTQKIAELMREIETLRSRLADEMEKTASLTREVNFLRKQVNK